MRTCQYDLTNRIRDGIDHLPSADVYVLHFRNMGSQSVIDSVRRLRKREPGAKVLLYLNVLACERDEPITGDTFRCEWWALHRQGLTGKRAWAGSTPELFWIDPNQVSANLIASSVRLWWGNAWEGVFDGILLDYIAHFAPGGPDGHPDYIERNEHELGNYRGWQIGFMSELKKFCGLLYANGAGAQRWMPDDPMDWERAWHGMQRYYIDGVLWESFGAPPWNDEGPEEQIQRAIRWNLRDHLFLPPDSMRFPSDRFEPWILGGDLSRTMAVATGGAYVKVVR